MSAKLTGIVEANYKGAGGKNERGISNPCGRMGSSRSLTKTNHGDVSYKNCTCCNPLLPCCLFKFLLHSVQHEDKSCSYVQRDYTAHLSRCPTQLH